MINVQQAVATKREIISMYQAEYAEADPIQKKQRELLDLQANLTAIDQETNATDYGTGA